MLGQCGSRRGLGQLCRPEAGHSELPQRVVSRKDTVPGLPWGWAGSRQAGALLFASISISPKPQRMRDLVSKTAWRGTLSAQGRTLASGQGTVGMALLDSPRRYSEVQNLGLSLPGLFRVQIRMAPSRALLNGSKNR